MKAKDFIKGLGSKLRWSLLGKKWVAFDADFDSYDPAAIVRQATTGEWYVSWVRGMDCFRRLYLHWRFDNAYAAKRYTEKIWFEIGKPECQMPHEE